MDELSLEIVKSIVSQKYEPEEVRDIVVEWRALADSALSSSTRKELKRVLRHRIESVESVMSALSGFNSGDLLEKDVPSEDFESPFSVGSFDKSEYPEKLDVLLSGDELDESDGIDWLMKGGFERARRILDDMRNEDNYEELLNVLWQRLPRIFLFYRDSFWPLVRYFVEVEKKLGCLVQMQYGVC